MVDLMMWLVIAALLLAAAIQGIGYYQKTAHVHQMQSDLSGAGANVMAMAANNSGVIDRETADDGVAETKWSAQVSYSVEDSAGGGLPYLRATHPGVNDLDVVYLFEECAPFKVGVNLISKSNMDLAENCGIVTPETPEETPTPTPTSTATPTPTPTPTPTTATPASFIASWGTPMQSRLDNSETTTFIAPTAVTTGLIPAEKTITALSSGLNHTCAIAGGEAFCEGFNSKGAIGNGTTTITKTLTPVDTSGVLNGKTVTKISASSNGAYTCAVADGKAYCWGQNTYGQLGDGTTIDSSVPVAVSTTGVLNGKTVTDISAGSATTCAVASGAFYCWGQNNEGQMGSGNTTGSSTPVAVSASGVLSGKTATNVSVSTSFTCAVASSRAYCWGRGTQGQHGNGANATMSTTPVAVLTSGALNGTTVTAVSARANYSCVVASSRAYCWGDNSDGQLGNGTQTSSNVPLLVSGGAINNLPVTSISTGTQSACAMANGAAYCWGTSRDYQLGNGTSGSTPVRAVAVSTAGVLNGKTVIDVYAGTTVGAVLYK